MRTVTITPGTIFEPLPGGRFASAYAIANRLHVTTREVTVRAAVLLEPGQPFSAALAHETERKLRGLEFLVPDSIEVTPVGDSVDVHVHTQDQWTTSPELNLEHGGGRTFGMFAFTERNLLGLGTTLSLSYREDPTGISRNLQIADGDVFGTHLHAGFLAGTGSSGKVNAASLSLPFYAEKAPTAFGGSWSRSVSEAVLFQEELEAARFARQLERAELFWGRGHQGSSGVVRRSLIVFESLDRRFGPTQLDPGAPLEFAGPTEELRLRRIEGEVRLWRPHFVERTGVEQFDRVEDFDLGPSGSIRLGVAPQFLGSSADEGHARARLEGGLDGGRLGFALGRGSFDTRLRSGLREALAQFEGRLVAQPLRDHTTVFAAMLAAGYRMPRDFQAEVGGLSGLRGYAVHALTGPQVWRLNAEHRWVARRNIGDLLSIGGATFWDAGRAWGPGSNAGPWHYDAGVGLRLSLPRSALNRVARFDVAWPISPTRDGHRSPVLSFGSSQAF